MGHAVVGLSVLHFLACTIMHIFEPEIVSVRLINKDTFMSLTIVNTTLSTADQSNTNTLSTWVVLLSPFTISSHCLMHGCTHLCKVC